MREISLITGQLHRAIYNLNEEARRTANQKFASGLTSAPERSLKKALDQFRQSLEEGDSTVRRRTASLLVTLIRSFEQISPTLHPEVLLMIDLGLADDEPLVREATVESYSQLLNQIDDSKINDPQYADAPGKVALSRILDIAITDPEEIVREAAVVSVAVQESLAVQEAGVTFLLDHVNDRRYRYACRSLASLAEFPSQQPRYLKTLRDALDGGDWRFRRSALQASLRLAKLDSLPESLLPQVTRRMFDGNKKVADAAQEVVQAALGAIARENEVAAEFLTECLWLAKQADLQQHLPAIIETQIVGDNLEDCCRLCSDRLSWHSRKRSTEPPAIPAVESSSSEALTETANQLVSVSGRSAIGWMAGAFIK